MLKKVILPLAFAATTAFSAFPAMATTHSQAPAASAAATVAAALPPLIDAQALKAQLGRDDLRILDIRTGSDYAAGHLPGAINTPYGKYRGPQDNPGQLPDEAALTELLQTAGVDAGTQVVVVHGGASHTDFGAAARVYWTLKVGGLTRLSILDGGTKAWQAAGGALDSAAPAVARSRFNYRYDQAQIVSGDELAAALEAGKAPALIDARPAKFFSGEVRVDAAARYGTLPGARSLDNAQFFPEGGTTLKPAGELKALVAQAGAADTPVVSFCNTGHWAATNWFVMSEIAGNKEVKLYPESVVGWSKTALPMENQPSRVTALIQDVKRALDK